MQDKYDDLLINGLIKLKEIEFSFVPRENEIEYVFSDKYIKAKNKLLKKIGYSYWKYVNTIAKKAAVIIITLIVAFSSLLTVDAFRNKFVDFIFKIYETFTEIKSTDKNYTDQIIYKRYTTNSIPTQFSKNLDNNNNGSSVLIWSNNREKDIILTQTLTTVSSSFNSENGKLNETTINDTPCLTCANDKNYFCYWEFDEYRFELIYPLELGEEFMCEIVGKLIEYKPESAGN